jgi:hypothetical protein
MYDVNDAHIYGNCGLDDEKGLDDCNFPPRIGKQGVNGSKAAICCERFPSINLFYKSNFKNCFFFCLSIISITTNMNAFGEL